MNAIDAMQFKGVRMLVVQGNLDHWFGKDLWGSGSNPSPTDMAFAIATEAGLLERHHTGEKWRLTNLGRSYRSMFDYGGHRA